MSTQLESRHFFRESDVVVRRDGIIGTVAQGEALYAVVVWDDGTRAEVDQFDSRVLVVQRGAAA